jgi:hypothetical protein
LAESRNAAVSKTTHARRWSIPADATFTVFEALREGGSTFLAVTGRQHGYGWVHASSLAGARITLSEERPFDPCARAQVRIRHSFDQIVRDRAVLGTTASVSNLVKLDLRTRALLRDGKRCGDDYPLDEATAAALKIEVGHYSSRFVYPGTLLGEAHRVDPNSNLRSTTLFATVERFGDTTRFQGLPDFEAAKAYLGEFPAGHFAADAAFILASGYNDAWNALEGDPLGTGHLCNFVAESLADLKGRIRSDQKADAKMAAERYYRLAFRLRRPDQSQRGQYEAWRDGHPYYVYCSD